ncbi:MAG: hypothetical protein KJO49_08475 [Bacteroidia bacterium]|nr:hypothetical protein [Bacteroidia bacterium]MBT8269952.1 hypothetical protein [Bacteroidia bacterium]NNF83218.1 hypothetical protein [Flavobacteriaceae bacterium]NNK70587.1 hypothetical protein [Flavobacteriaceae bacterium]NNL80330.1 hypothetical protein [Flavobacteriaceae bacterium]
MKRIFGILSLVLIFSTYSFAQQPSMVQRGQRGYTAPMQFDNTAYIKLTDPVEETQRVLEKCVSAFNLDDFQKEIMKNILTKRFEDHNVILSDEDNTKDLRRKKIEAREKLFVIELETIITRDQVEQFKDMDFSETKEDKKKKKKRKRKRNKDS